ncbi:MAG: dihydropteroate synthase [Deltaproteobacteria bacterium]|nr:dihydropteroate synthase [Deltaproteobacteria bacterium]
MGILNVTPDSFSDGGLWLDPGAAEARAQQMVAQGASIVDVGGESTRPGSEPVALEVELERVIPVVRRLAKSGLPVPISVDTRRAEVARRALDEGAGMVNDVSGLADDPAMGPLVARTGAAVVLMHRRGPSSAMYDSARYEDVAREVKSELGRAVARAREAGIGADRILVDPGIGFSKRAEHSVEVLARLDEILELGFPVVVGPSRKSFIGQVAGGAENERVGGTAAAVALAIWAGAHVVRVHDVAAMRQAAVLAHAISRRRRHGP